MHLRIPNINDIESMRESTLKIEMPNIWQIDLMAAALDEGGRDFFLRSLN